MNEKYKNLNTIDIHSKSIRNTKNNENPDIIIKNYLDDNKIPYFINIPSILYKNNIISEDNKDSFLIVNYKLFKEHKFDLLEGEGITDNNKLQFLCSVKDRKYNTNSFYNFLSKEIEIHEYYGNIDGLGIEFNNVKCVGKFYYYPPIFGRYSNSINPIIFINDDVLFNKLLDIVITKYVYRAYDSNISYLHFVSDINELQLNELKKYYNDNLNLENLDKDMTELYLFKSFKAQNMHKSSSIIGSTFNKREFRKNVYLYYFIFSTILIYLYYIVINSNSAFDKKISVYLLCGGNKKSIILSKFIQIILFFIINIMFISLYVNHNYTKGVINILGYLQTNKIIYKPVTHPKFLFIGIILFLISFLITGGLQLLKFRKLNTSEILKNRN
ncbi:MAG: hypothetical protein ACTTID_03015 [Bacillales bacterium]